MRPYSGVFVYGPRPVYHNTYYVQGGRPSGAVQVQKDHMPKRKIDRGNTLAVGLKAGSYFGAYQGANAYADLGLGLNARYRPAEAFGLELAAQRHFDDERTHTAGSASAMLFAFPWTRVSPYVLGGATLTDRQVSDTIFRNDELQVVEATNPWVGVHGGVGIEFAIGKKAAIDLEARYIGYVNRQVTDPTLPGAVTTSAGLMWHF